MRGVGRLEETSKCDQCFTHVSSKKVLNTINYLRYNYGLDINNSFLKLQDTQAIH